MQRDLVPGADRFGEQGQILLVVTGSHHKNVACTPAAFSALSTSGVVLLGPSSKVRQTHFSGSGWAAGSCCSCARAETAGESIEVSGAGVRSCA